MTDSLPLWPAGRTPPGEPTPEAPDEQPRLTPYLLPGDQLRAMVVVCPGGGYHGRAAHEGEPIARWLNQIGLHAVVLDYRVKHRYPASLSDARRAIQTVRAHAADWRIDPHRVGILGFSAGGHLAANATTDAIPGDPHATDPIERHSSRPNAAVLCYPVISAGFSTHTESINMLLGPQPWDESARRRVSLELLVNAQTPPCFIWHTSDDAVVPLANALCFAEALANA
ncbi:MAG: alpha/beta hydrolase, partial [Planctomycetota bacterium]